MIDSKLIEKAVYDLCVQANTTLPEDVYTKILDAYNKEKNNEAKQALGLILTNAQMAYNKKMPLCQDTGQVLVFVKGNNFPENLNGIISKSVSKAYEENSFRKSIVKNALFERTNTKTNTPCVIHTEIGKNNELEIELLIKGAGSENVCAVEMLSPTSNENEVVNYVASVVKKAGAKGCPPYFIGIGIGGTIDYASVLSKKALLLEKNIDKNHENLAQKIKDAVNDLNIGAAGLGGASTTLDVKILTDFTHIACMPVAVTINCNSSRHAKCIITEHGIEKPEQSPWTKQKHPDFLINSDDNYIKVHSTEIEKLKSLKQGQNVLLSGEIYTARDMAHKRLVEMIEKGEELPFDLKDKIIFYAGPCPGGKCGGTNCVIGSIGPTTASRMDKFAPILYKNGILATIGKGERLKEVENAIKNTGGIYFTMIGGIACYLSQKFIEKELVAFKDLGTEAIYRFKVKDLPLRTAII